MKLTAECDESSFHCKGLFSCHACSQSQKLRLEEERGTRMME